MNYIQRAPNINLATYINSIWYFEHQFDCPTDLIYLPKHTHFITISFDDLAKLKFDGREEYTIAPMTLGGLLDKTTLNIHLNGKVRFIGIDFKPFGFYKLTNQSCELFVNQSNDMSLFFKKSETDDLYEKLYLSKNVDDCFEYLQEFFTKEFNKRTSEKLNRKISKVNHAIQLITNSDKPLHIKELSSELAMSDRNFQRLFNDVVGVSPKSWSDKYKFQQIMTGLNNKEWKSLEDAAFSNGFTDISHFYKFFKSQTGFRCSEILSSYGSMYNSIFQYEDQV